MAPTPSFSDLRALLARIPPLDDGCAAAVRQRGLSLTKPPGSLGRLETLVEWLAAVQGRERPTADRPLVAVFAGNHGVVAQGVSPYPASVTAAMVANFGAGGAAINQICKAYGLGLKVFELALDHPTADFTKEPALEESACAATMVYGMEAIAGADMLCLGEMGIGNTTSAAALYTALYGGPASGWVGRGTGVDDSGLARKIDAVARAIALHGPFCADPLEALRRLGGREIAAMAGAILAARIERVPVILDGYVGTAAASVMHALDPRLIEHCIAGHESAEGAHRAVLDRLGLKPMLSLGMRLGEGSGAALAAGIVSAALQTFNGMATFEQAGVANRDDS